MRAFSGVCFWGCVLLASAAAVVGQSLVREANTTLTLPLQSPVSGYGLTRALGDLHFDEPVAIAFPPDETNRLFVLEREGRICVVTNLAAPTKTVFMDLRASVSAGYIEMGLLGMAFHPGYSTNRYFYIYRTLVTSTEGAGNSLHNQLSRFEASASDPNVGLPGSEVVFFAQYDTSPEHNAGDVHFGPDGYLYVSLGEEVFPIGAQVPNHQPIDSKLHGAIVRIDVDKRPGSLPPNPRPGVSTNYSIPPDNPFIGLTNYQGNAVDPAEVRTEFYAIGFRNPWRFCFDPLNGELYCGDVGAGTYEEVSVITAGANYGWPFLEATHPTSLSPPPDFNPVEPIVEYIHGNATNQGTSVTGGVVYRGTAIPQLYGAYVFGDYVRGHIWAVEYDGTPGLKPFHRLTGDLSVSAFGYDPRDGEILVANLHEGHIKKLVYVPPAQAAAFPETLAETGAFSNPVAMTPQTGIVPYNVSLRFWSDHAVKTRWFCIPDLTNQFGFHADDNWNFPTGAVWIKHFDLEITNGVPASRRKLETRFLVEGTDGLYGVTYIWDAAQTNAVLAPEEGVNEPIAVYNPDGTLLRNQIWRYPSRSECRTCHNDLAGHALGFSTAQLNCANTYGGAPTNQLIALSQAGYLDTAISSVTEYRRLYKATDTSRSLYDRARSYLHANCVSCHRPGSRLVNSSYWDARVHVPLSQSKIVNNYYVTPGDPPDSWIHKRISVRGPSWQMPPIGSAQLDQENVELMRDWILGFPSAPWTPRDLGSSQREGSSSVLEGEYQVAGTGSSSTPTNDTFHFLSRFFAGNGHLVARLTSQTSTNPEARAGLMMRQNTSVASPYVMISQDGAGQGVRFESRASVGIPAESSNSVPSATSEWLRLLRQGSTFTGHVSVDGTNWTQVGQMELALGSNLSAGFAVFADNAYDVNLARFRDFSLLGLSANVSFLPGQNVAPAYATLESTVNQVGAGVAEVQFREGSNVLGVAFSPPYELGWSNVDAGVHEVTAFVTDTNGLTVASQPITVEVHFPVAQAQHATNEWGSGGDWQERFGTGGFVLAGDSTNLPAHTFFSSTGASPFLWANTTDPRALVRADQSGRIAACWFSDNTMVFDLPFTDGGLKNLTLYCVDWDDGGRVQQIDLVDAETGQTLASETLSNFVNGVYLTWTVRGHVEVHVTSLTSNNAVVSAVFIDAVANDPPLVEIVSPADASLLMAPTNVVVQTVASDPDGAVTRVECFVDGVKMGEMTNAPFDFVWPAPLAGGYVLTARAWDNLNESRLSNPNSVTVTLPGAWTEFIEEDDVTQGDWIGAYGGEGYVIVEHATSLPNFVDLLLDTRTFLWANNVTVARALKHVAGPYRIAACHVDTTSFEFDTTLLDGWPHRFAIYFLDWDSTSRKVRVDVTELGTGTLLDSRVVENFNPGRYLVWTLRGAVRVTLTRLQGNAVLSGVFLDPAAPVDVWRSEAFSTAQLRDPLVSGDLMDPDLDGRLNLFEHAVGSHPLVPDTDSAVWGSTDPVSGLPEVSYIRSKKATDVQFSLRGTSDWMQWEDVNGLFEPVAILDNGASEIVRMRLVGPAPSQLFLRLEVARAGEN